MNVVILGGFLGSGKTTFLLRLARYLTENSDSSSEYKVVVLENEVGDISIDDGFLSSSGFQTRNLFSGCACCTLAGELGATVRDIDSTYSPDWLVVEASGVAYPEKMKQIIETIVSGQVRTIVLTDAFRWKRLLRGLQMVIPMQLEGADIVLVNKADKVSAEGLEEVMESLRSLCDGCPILPMSAKDDVPEEFWEELLSRIDL
ncbi:MAG: GTP-binding protein [Actinobacteria bacterium]|nr:GTP-binding protein [Actinomycetota bacterium]